jgi:hypothetical protein
MSELSCNNFAIVLNGVSDKWEMNVLQVRGLFKPVKVTVDGHGTVEAPAIVLRPTQARHLARQITELLGEEH